MEPSNRQMLFGIAYSGASTLCFVLAFCLVFPFVAALLQPGMETWQLVLCEVVLLIGGFGFNFLADRIYPLNKE